MASTPYHETRNSCSLPPIKPINRGIGFERRMSMLLPKNVSKWRGRQESHKTAIYVDGWRIPGKGTIVILLLIDQPTPRPNVTAGRFYQSVLGVLGRLLFCWKDGMVWMDTVKEREGGSENKRNSNFL